MVVENPSKYHVTCIEKYHLHVSDVDIIMESTKAKFSPIYDSEWLRWTIITLQYLLVDRSLLWRHNERDGV